VNQYTYDPYGQQTTVSSSAPNLFGYAGGLQVPGTGLIHFGARYYNPALGQWTQLDPTGQNAGYTYVGDNPINYTDPTGLQAISFGWSGCFIDICAEGSIGVGGISSTVGSGAGIGAGADAYAALSTGTGAASGSGTEFECSAANVTAGLNSSGEFAAGVTTGTEYACALYSTVSSTLATW
jgi:RHS repeat-associated protein